MLSTYFSMSYALGLLAVVWINEINARPSGSPYEFSLPKDLQHRSDDDETVLKIMPLGASITSGQGSSDGNGYRLDLRDLLETQGKSVSYVGTQWRGNMSNNAHEGYPGYTISEVDDALSKSGAYDFIPNVILINAGTNDCGYKRTDPNAVPSHMATLLDHIKTNDPSALVIVSSLLPNGDADTNDCIVTLNPKLKRVTQLAGARGQKTAFVDMYDAVPSSDLNSDGTHPNDDGFARMARVWFDGILGAAALISAPDPNGKPAP